MAYRGDIRLGDTIDLKFTTVDSTGAPTTLAGTPVVSAYVGNGTTEITAGITLSVDFDSRTGMHNVRVVASSGNGFATATNVELVITTGTVGGVSVVGYVIGSFSIEARSAVMPTTAARTLDVSATGEAGVDWANVGSPTTTLALTGTTIATTQKVDIETIKTNPVVNGGTITFPTTATLASTTNITAGTITTATTATNVTTVSSGAISEASYATTAGSFAPLMIVDRGTAQSATGTTLVLRSAAAFADSELVGATIVIRTATTGAGQSRKITAYVGSTDTATVDTWTTTPTGTITYDIFGTAKESASLNQVDVTKWNGTAVSSPATAGIPDVNVKNIDNDAASASGTVTFPNATLASTTNITAATGVDITKILGTAISTPATAGILDVNVKNIDNDAASASGTVTFPNATLASTTNITAGTLTTVTTATNVTTVNGLAANVITATSIATDAITAGKIAADAIGASELAADAVAEIADAVWDEAIAGHLGAGSTGEALNNATAPTAATVADAVWDELLAGHVGVGSAGLALTGAGAAGDPWNTALPGAYGAGTAGKIIGDNINATVSSRATQTSVDTIDDFVDTEVAAIKTKTDFLPSATAGAAGGLAIAGSNAATTFATLTVTGATTLTGNVALADGLAIAAPSTAGRTGMTISGNGAGAALRLIGGATGNGFQIAGGGSSGDGISVTTTSGHGVNIAPVGSSKHGIFATGGNAGTSDGIKAVAGTGGVDIRGNITGDVTGNLSGSVGSVTGAVGSVTGLTAATVHSDLDDIQARLPAALTSDGNIKADALRVNGSAVAAVNLARSARSIVTVTVGSASTTTSVVTSALSPAGADTATDQLKGRILIFDDTTTTAALRGQATDITGSSTGGVLTVTALTTAPASGDTGTVV